MEKHKIKLVKWLSNLMGYKIAMVKISKGEHSIHGDLEMLRYLDIPGYSFKKEPLKREFKN